MSDEKVQRFCIQMYTWALRKSEQESLDETLFIKQIQSELKKSKIPYSSIKKIVSVPKSQWIEDLLQITKDLRLTFQTFKQYHKKLSTRAQMHFTNGHKQNLSKLKHKTKPVKNVIEMYEKDQPKEWSQDKAIKFCDKILANTVYLIGLTKANGVIVENEYVVTCAHALMDQEENLMNFRCFVTGNGTYGIIKVQKDTVCKEKDVGIGRIRNIYNSKGFQGSKELSQGLKLKIPQGLKLKQQFSQIRCLQVGLLFNTQPQDTFIKAFQPAQGFIEQNLYTDHNDYRLIEDMGLLIHNCYGLWGTSGSPLWTGDGELIGIHNAWNENGYNVSMIVRDDDGESVRVVRQYERRAIGVHVIMGMLMKWFGNDEKGFQEIMDVKQPQFKFHSRQQMKKKVKLY